ncbi:MAG: CheR family methyltransferase, partial [Gammaproteobacteria bacterium]
MLAEWTALTVIEGVDGTVIQQGYVYVTPSRNLTSVRHGKLQVHQGGYQQHHLIDFLFHSVAADLGAKAVGIIFSGHLNDGASGLAAIRGNGGLGLVQEPATAEFDCMPLSAIEAGGADKIAAPARMPELILNFNRALKSIAKNVKVHDGHTNKILEAILDLLSRSEDRSYLGYKKTTLLRRIERRMSLCLLDDLHRYLEKLRNNPVELKQLAADLLIGVTAFFRDPKAFQVLETEVIPEIFSKNQPGRPIRAWIAGCSTGQEAYSVALQLYEYRRQAGLSQAIVIFATDINETALDEARRGCFSRDSVMSQVPDALIERYFVADPHGFSICNEIRELLIFAPHNLLCDPPFFRLDLIICRNVFIYMEPEIQNRLLAVFRFALNEQGYLFLGSSEAIGIQAHHFKVISKQ